MRDDLEQEIIATAHRVTLDDALLTTHRIQELTCIRLGSLIQIHLNVSKYIKADPSAIDLGTIAADYTRLFKAPNPSETRRLRETYLARQLDIRHPTVPLQSTQDLALGTF